MSSTRRPAPPPLEGNDLLIAGVITVGWAVALLILLIGRSSIPASDRWWIWVCAAGLLIGLFALGYVPRLKRSRARSARQATADGAPAGNSDQLR